MADTSAWRDLSPVARALYTELGLRHGGANNGKIHFSAREAADNLGISKDTASRKFKELEAHGFIVRTSFGSFNCKIKHASEFRLTALPSCDGTPATKDFVYWPGKKQNPVRPEGHRDQTAGTGASKATSNGVTRSMPSDRETLN